MNGLRVMFSGMCCLMGALVVVTATGTEQEASQELTQVVVHLLGDQDKELRSLGLEQVRTGAKGQVATEIFAAQLQKLSSEAQVGLLRALANRGDPAARPEVLRTIASSHDEAVQIAAILTLGSLGNAQDLPLLFELLSVSSAGRQEAIRTSLTRLSGAAVAKTIGAEVKKPVLTSGMSKTRVVLIQILAERRAFDAIPQLLAVAVDPDAAVRRAAMTALGQLADACHLVGMVQGVLMAQPGRERAAAEKNVMFVCSRIEEDERRSQSLLTAMAGLSVTDRLSMLSTLGRIGGTAARKAIEGAIAEVNPEVHKMGIRAIGNWPNATIVPRLLELAETDEHPAHRIIALRALIRVAPLPDERPLSEKLALLQKAMEMSTRDEERQLVLRRAPAIRTIETLHFILAYIDNPKVAQQACESLVELAHHRGLREPHKAEFHQALDQVIQTSKNAIVIDRARRYKKDQTWVRAKSG